MPLDNVLVSREKWERMLEVLYHQHLSSDGYENKEILSMPDFIESERDVEVVEDAIDSVREHFLQRATFDGAKSIKDRQSRAAINALRIKGE